MKAMFVRWDELDASETKNECDIEESIVCFMALQNELTDEHFHYDTSSKLGIDHHLMKNYQCFQLEKGYQ